jgi:hypothetical protein
VEARYFYARNNDGSPGYRIIYSIWNHSPLAITASRVELLDSMGKVRQTVAESTLRKTSSGGIVETNKSLSLSYKISELPPDIKEWIVRWYYTGANGQRETVEGNYIDRH